MRADHPCGYTLDEVEAGAPHQRAIGKDPKITGRQEIGYFHRAIIWMANGQQEDGGSLRHRLTGTVNEGNALDFRAFSPEKT